MDNILQMKLKVTNKVSFLSDCASVFQVITCIIGAYQFLIAETRQKEFNVKLNDAIPF